MSLNVGKSNKEVPYLFTVLFDTTVGMGSTFFQSCVLVNTLL